MELHATVSETGGWSPADLTAQAGQPLRLRLISDDVVHGFAIGQSAAPPLDLPPGQVVETTLAFDRPGKYVYYCTRWCGPNHWRMRGTIEVAGALNPAPTEPLPLYLTLGLDLDAPHPAAVVPGDRPSAVRVAAYAPGPTGGAGAGGLLPADPPTTRLSDYSTISPSATWGALRADPALSALDDRALWDLIAFLWQSRTAPASLATGRALYAANCAACHGEAGAGDGVMAAPALRSDPQEGAGVAATPAMPAGHETQSPANFTDPATMLGASSALLEGKIIRGGMGTGMPYWGPIFTGAQTRALVDFLWAFQFEYEEQP